MSLRDGIAQLRIALDRYAGVEQTLTEIESDVVVACRQIVDAAGAGPKTSATGFHEFRRPISVPMQPHSGITMTLSVEKDNAPGGTEARKRGPMGADTPSPARRVAKKKPHFGPGQKPWKIPPAKPKVRDTSPAPESTHTAAIAQIEKKLDRTLTVKETTAAEVLLDGGTVQDVAAALSLSYAGAYYYAQKLGIDAPQARKPETSPARRKADAADDA